MVLSAAFVIIDEMPFDVVPPPDTQFCLLPEPPHSTGVHGSRG
jgi:hypothetical protein